MKKEFFLRFATIIMVFALGIFTATAETITFQWDATHLTATSGTVDEIGFETGITGSASACAYNATNGLVLYGVSSGGGYFNTKTALSGAITSVSVTTNAKKNTPKYNVYGSTDGSNWTQVGNQITVSSNNTQSFDFSGASYTYFKIANTANATAQLGVNSIVITYNSGPQTYSVNYNLNEGAGEIADDNSYNPEDTVTVTSLVPTRTGYTFAGWNTAEDGTGTGYKAGDTFEINSNVTLYAQWNINSYSVTWMVNGVVSSTTHEDYGSQPTLPTAPTSAEFDGVREFAGWTTAETITDGSAPAVLFTNSAGAPEITSDVTFRAVFATKSGGEELSETVGFESSEGYTSSTTYNSSDYTTGTKGSKWKINYGAFSTSSATHGSQSAQFRIYSSGEYGQLYNSVAYSSDISKVTFYGKVNNTNVNVIVSYSENGNDWMDLETVDLTTTDTQYTITTTGNPKYIKFTAAGKKPNSGNYQIYIDDVGIYMGATTYSNYAITTSGPIYYSVSYDENGGEGSVVGGSYESGTEVTVAENGFTRTGYTFTGWNTSANGTGTAYAVGDKFNLNENTTLYAQWKINTYTVTWLVNGAEKESFTVNYGVKPSLPDAPTSAQFDGVREFVGWTTAEAITDGEAPAVLFTTSNDAPIITSDMTFRAVFAMQSGAEELAETVGFESSEGYTSSTTYNSSDYKTGTKGSKWKINYGAFSTSGAMHGSQSAQFRIYSGTNGGYGQLYNSEAYSSNICTFSFYGKASNANGKVIVYCSDNGSSWTELQTIDLSTTKTQYTVTPSGKPKYIKFKAEGTRPSSSNYQIYIDDVAIYVGATSYDNYAITSSGPIYYSVSYDSNDGEGSVEGGAYTNGSLVTVASGDALTREHYNFSGWNTAADGSGTAYQPGDTFTISGSVTLYAQWTIKKYSVTYYSNGGTGNLTDEDSPYDANTEVMVLDNAFSRSGYNFTTWNMSADGSGTSYAEGATFTITGDVALYAQWEERSAIFTFFHEGFGNNTVSARDWNDNYKEQSGEKAIYKDAAYTVTNARQSKNTVGSTNSGLSQYSNGTDAVFEVGPLHLEGYTEATLSYKWKAGSVSGTYFTKVYYKTDAESEYVEMPNSAKGATSFVNVSVNVPEAAMVNTAYFKVVFNTSNTQAVIDEFDLSGKEGKLNPNAWFDLPVYFVYQDGSRDIPEHYSLSDAAVTHASADNGVAAIDGTTINAGNSTGSTVVNAQIADNDVYAAASASYVVKVVPSAIDLTFDSYINTFSSEYMLDLSNVMEENKYKVRAFVVNSFKDDASCAYLTEVTNTDIPAETGLVIVVKLEEGQEFPLNVSVPVLVDCAPLTEVNFLHAALQGDKIPATDSEYVRYLYDNEAYKFNMFGSKPADGPARAAGSTIASKNTAYLEVSSLAAIASNASFPVQVYGEDIYTGVEGTLAEPADMGEELIFNVWGQRVDKDYQGIIIKNGKKIFNHYFNHYK